jgi:hypothetical protein
MSKRYNLEEIKCIFRIYREIKFSRLTDDEFDLFCRALSILPKEIVDSVNRDVDFILLSAHDQNAAEQACSIMLEEVPKEKKALIILTPLVFEYVGRPNGEKESIRAILHEVAHVRLKHKPYTDREDKKKKEEEADQQVVEWLAEAPLFS